MQNIEDALERTGLIVRSTGLLQTISVLLLYPRFHPDQSTIASLLRKYGKRASELPEPTSQDVEKAKTATGGKSRTIEEWILMTADPEPVEAQI